MTAPDVVVLGNLLVDDVVLRDGRTRMGEAGGAILYVSLAVALWGLTVGVVSVAGDDYPTEALEALAKRGVDLSGVRRLGGPGVRTWLLYEEAGRRVVHQLGRPSHVDVSPCPEDVPPSYLEARAFHLAPMPLECQHALVTNLRQRTGAFLSIDPHVPLNDDTMSQWARTLIHADGLLAGEDELDARLAADPQALLERLAKSALRYVAIKRAGRGGILLDREGGRSLEWPGSPRPAVDTTGAGDAFAGGFLAGLLDSGRVEDAIERGAVSASFAIEDWGARGLLAATRERAEERRESWYGARWQV